MDRRLWEVDVARGIALLLMIVFNWSFALHFLGIYTIAPPGSFLYWDLFPRFIGFLFIFIVGVSLTLSVKRLKSNHPEKWERIADRKYPARGLRILGLGLGITAVTFLLYPQRYIFFGVLHLIGASIILARPFLTRARKALIAGILLIGASFLARTITVNSRVLASLGFSSPHLYLDYFPILPWTGVVFLGIWVGHRLFPEGERRFNVRELEELSIGTRILGWVKLLGQRTLVIYLAHQPALVLLLMLLGYEVF